MLVLPAIVIDGDFVRLLISSVRFFSEGEPVKINFALKRRARESAMEANFSTGQRVESTGSPLDE
jgi:hypothetical protein